jgi:F420-dependent methylenetetrahydromethanopterin dehydrogenase
MERNAPFLIVVGKHAGVASGPVAAEILFRDHDWLPAIIARDMPGRQCIAALLHAVDAGTMTV